MKPAVRPAAAAKKKPAARTVARRKHLIRRKSAASARARARAAASARAKAKAAAERERLEAAERRRVRLERLQPARGSIVQLAIRDPLPPLRANASAAERAFRAMEKASWGQAIAAYRRVRDPLTRKMLTWYRLQSRTSGASFGEIHTFLQRNPDWPLGARLRYRAEMAMGWSHARDADVLAFFKDKAPRTLNGAMRLAEALRNSGRPTEATTLLKRTWARGRTFGPQERAFLKRFGDDLTVEDHAARVHTMIYRNRRRTARVYIRAHRDKFTDGMKALFRARLLLSGRRAPSERRVEKALAAIPEAERKHPALAHDLIRWHRRKDRLEEAVALLNATDASGEPERPWWQQRAWVARVALRFGKPEIAYAVARDHHAKERRHIYEGEWLAGWIALRYLRKPALAKPHFERLYKLARYPVSWARGAYWLGRTAEARGDRKAALAWYQKAAQYVQTYYGQFALAKLGRKHVTLPARTAITPAQRAAFERKELVRAARRLEALNQRDIARWFVFAAFDTAKTPAERALASQLGIEIERLETAVRTAKYAGRYKQLLVESGYPIIMVPAEIGAEPALILSLIRQESEFNHEAISWAGARGLMQLMPRTAYRTARNIKVRYNRKALIRNPHYNMKIGTSHVVELMEELGGNYVLVAGAYNAGIGAVNFWLSVNGDPRGGSAERWIDWIEAIPVPETRNYVQRVLEAVQVYRARLGDNTLSVANIAKRWNGTVEPIDVTRAASVGSAGNGKGCVTQTSAKPGSPAC
ncbi:MAG: lytic transglycosylase domain-containing protein [Alphaproteobacteria bacterium]